MRVELTFVIRHHDRPLALSRAIDNALKAGLTRPETTRCARGSGTWIVDVAGHVPVPGGSDRPDAKSCSPMKLCTNGLAKASPKQDDEPIARPGESGLRSFKATSGGPR
jgi:hypothetical protein